MSANRLCLVVDDSRALRKVARRMLEELGWTVQEAEDGERALAACADAVPDVILLDWNMPVMTGIEFVRRLRGASFGATPKVVFCTTESEMERICEALDSGADEYIMKPFDKDILSAKLAMAGIA